MRRLVSFARCPDVCVEVALLSNLGVWYNPNRLCFPHILIKERKRVALLLRLHHNLGALSSKGGRFYGRYRKNWLLRRILQNMPRTCKGCKLGYLDGSRELRRAKCGMKVCCLTKGHITCADCERFDSCETLQGFLLHPGYKYSKCGQALAFIRANGYSAFLEVADRWKNAYGKFE